jgi:hypothetical protein
VYDLNISYCSKISDISALRQVKFLDIIRVFPKKPLLFSNSLMNLCCSVGYLEDLLKMTGQKPKRLFIDYSLSGIRYLNGFMDITMTVTRARMVEETFFDSVRCNHILNLIFKECSFCCYELNICHLPVLSEFILIQAEENSHFKLSTFDWSSLPCLMNVTLEKVKLGDLFINKSLRKLILKSCSFHDIYLFETIQYFRMFSCSLEGSVFTRMSLPDFLFIHCNPQILPFPFHKQYCNIC